MNVSSSETPAHQYAAHGDYTISLEATSDRGCSSSADENITVYAKPEAQYVAEEACYGDSTYFQDHSYIAEGVIASYQYDLGDGNASTSANPVHLYDTARSFTTVMTVTSDNNCSDTYNFTYTVNPEPVAAIGADEVCLGLRAQQQACIVVNP